MIHSALPIIHLLRLTAVITGIGVSIVCARAEAVSTATPLTTEALSFDRIATTDLPALKNSLEKAGWPDSHIRALLGLEVQRRLNPEPVLRFEDLKPFHFWHTGPDSLPVSNLNTPELVKARTAREELVRAKYDELFPHAETETGLLDRWEEQRRWGDLPADKRAQVLALLDRSARARDDFLESRGRMLNPQEWETLWQTNHDTRRQLEQLLTADELLDYDLRNSNTAARMRNELDAFAPTRDEFIAVFRLRHPLELAFEDKPHGGDPAIDAQREAAEKSALEKTAALLGPARFDDYLISLDPVCQTLRFDGRHARTDAATVRRLYRSFLNAKQRLASLDTQPLPEREAAATSLKAGIHREFRTVFDEEATRRFLQEQSLWP
ncbi:hypothetical protein CMV30_08200 [Nibricoccus aquaticus]|uniref:Uncharacterized protein n=1 Tax=Nibricoccus aquaticus TaxID=2576891 RepID=A0A290Q5I4_9BACT|nr:hypothetical protein [Nibricoccus aquaticus]ATC63935.1 hypothetical protein CMV30_08200 [Nibricoccus aquaticus]